MQGGEELRRAVENLDGEGWNTEGQLYPNTTTRAHSKLAIVLNEILELSLGDLGDDANEKIKLVHSSSLFTTR
jgi:hypothetical protein